MSRYKPYPVYKDSGVAWIGRVSEHWDVKRLEHIVSTHRENVAPDALKQVDVLHFSIPAVQETGGGRVEAGSTIDSNKLVIRCPQVLISKLNPRKGTVVIADRHAALLTVASTEFVPLVQQHGRSVIPFIAALAVSEPLRQILESRVESVTRSHQRVAPDDILKASVAAPSPDEQTAIAAVLDRETTRIDALISRKTRFIELLQEKRQALITHAVTKGLDPNVKMKDSGVEWIGEVPEGWGVKPICRVASCNDDSLPENVQPDQILRYVDISSVNHTDGIAEVAEIRFADAPSRARRRAKTGDVVISTVRTYLKAVAAVTEQYSDCTYSTGFAVLRPRPSEITSEFLKWLALNDLVIQAIEANSEGLSYPAINAAALVKLKAVVPPPGEQTAISAVIDRETARIDTLIAKTQRSIDLIKERRSAFITAAVTGQIDLRSAA